MSKATVSGEVAGARRAPILLAGLPRSGTTWVGDILSHAGDVDYLFEPDNEKTSPMGWQAKSGLHRFPYLRAADAAPDFADFWRAVLFGAVDRWRLHSVLALYWRTRVAAVERSLDAATGVWYGPQGERVAGPSTDATRSTRAAGPCARLARASYDPDGATARRRIVKSVHCTFALDWLDANFAPRCVIVLRSPHALFASYRRMRMPDRHRNVLVQSALRADLGRYLHADRVPSGEDDEIAFQIALAYAVIAAEVPAHPEWTLLSHDRLCVAAEPGFAQLFRDLGLSWGSAPATRLAALDREGSGYEARRRTSEQPGKWRGELSGAQSALIDGWMDAFGVREFARERIAP